MSFMLSPFWRVLVVSILAASLAPAQEITGSITGTVSDNTGAVVPEANIVAVNLDTAAEARATTDANGNFLLPVLRAGRYRVTVERTGFQRHLIEDVRVNTSERARVDVTLNVGAVSETVSVTASAPLLQSEQATIGHVVEGQTITSIPLATRNFTQILGTSAGVVGAIMNADNRGTGSDSVSVNGARRGSNNLLVDGVPTTNQLNNAPDGDGTPSIEFLSEFKVLTSLYSAEFGRNSGSVINVTTRSGANAFHGSAYEFLRNTKFNARPFFFPQRRPNIQHQFGANAGGRIIKDRTFFFAGWESSRQRNGNGGGARLRVRTPTDAQREGVFPTPIFDPQAGALFPNNTIPASRINPTSKKISDTFFPKPNISDGSASNFEAFQNEPTDLNQYTVRIDHRFGDKDTINGRWFESFQKDLAPFGLGLPGFGNNANREKHTWGVTHTHLFSPTFVLETRTSGDYTDQFTFGQNRTDPTSVGLQPISGVTFAGEAAGMPRIEIANYINFGNQAHWSDFIDRYTGGATFTWTKSKHNFRFGGETQASLLNPQNNLQTRGRFTFQNIGTGQGGVRGDEYADFLLTLPFTKTAGAADVVNIGGQLKLRSHLHSFFLNDDWKVSRDITFTWGVRYEADFQAAAYNLNMLNFWPDRYRGIDGTMASTGLVQGGIDGVPNNTVNGDYNNFMPRIGIAWRIGDKWVVRTGAGLYFDLRTGQIAQQAFQNPPTYTEITAICSRGVLCTPNVPDNWTYLNPGHKTGLVPFPVSPTEERSVRGTERIVKTDNAWQYNFSIQRELPGNMLIETAYVGTKGTHLMAQRNFNPLVPVGGAPLASGVRLA
ncbi:MAG: TonB-dependent receptor, partial [Bryobacteraceae bacterium]|nr:TonB-dependent receptor [Bryobacteraceae bacterium]